MRGGCLAAIELYAREANCAWDCQTGLSPVGVVFYFVYLGVRMYVRARVWKISLLCVCVCVF